MKRILIISALLQAVVFSVTADRRRMLLSRNTAAASSPTPELLWWKLNEGSGTSIAGAASGGGDGGTTDAAWLTGKSGSGSALDFNGTSQDAATSSSITFGANIITISGWFYFDATNANQILVESSSNLNANNDSFSLLIDAGQLYLNVHNAGAYRSGTCAAGATGVWKHILAIADRSANPNVMTIYIDGVDQAATQSGLLTAVANHAAYTVYVGARGGTSLFYNGRIDDLRIYSGSKAANVTAIMNDAQ